MNQTSRHQTSFSRISFLLPIMACCLFLLTTAHAERSVSLAWSPSPDPSVAGYYVYSREENASTATRISAGPNTQATVTGLKEGLQYNFTVTAYSTTGAESAPSNEAFWRVPVPLNLLAGLPPGFFRRLQFPAAPGHWYELQASTDLKNWTTIWQSGTATTYSLTEVNDTKSGNYKNRFYRLQIH
jgi:hypothetical protein